MNYSIVIACVCFLHMLFCNVVVVAAVVVVLFVVDSNHTVCMGFFELFQPLFGKQNDE